VQLGCVIFIIPDILIVIVGFLLADNAGVIVNPKGEMKGKCSLICLLF
jgi:hypothetical protein